MTWLEHDDASRSAGEAPEETGLYVHVPFCGRRCSYCNFAIVAGRDDLIPRFLALAEAELRLLPAEARRLTTVHLGGGTPSRLSPEQVAGLLDAISRRFTIAGGAEIALEANPEDVTVDRVQGWRAAGIDRVTVGVQALDRNGLAAIGRPGDRADGPAALRRLRGAGIRSVGADLICGRPGQDLATWDRELEELISLAPDHVSVYALETDARTPLVRAIERGECPAPDDDLAAEMYARAASRLTKAGLPRYEISNFARRGHESRHNLRYWTDASYLGAGPSAASYWNGLRWTNPRGFGAWARRVERAEAPPEREPCDADRRAGEALVFGLRTEAGIDLERLRGRYGAQALGHREPLIRSMLSDGRLELTAEGRIAVPDALKFLADEIFVDLL